ncbi:hypothetical protein PHJA_000839100 [Phtheirospermum japonicum]|uniref:Uncharacterized protein n=1 Tax=Phtheirospermum japonicum TaxID=374723 RepID=A0A830BSD9_9LAMI|nr:hypothetical protein PHJA_000839100 [Phtheirospermum japonicum]
MASFHSRSNSFPSQSHPAMNDVEDHLERLKASQATSTSSSSSICANLASLRDLHDVINNMIQMPSTQQALSHEGGESWINELLEGSLRLVDLCGFSKDIAQLTRESVQDLESSIRRKSEDINAYSALMLLSGENNKENKRSWSLLSKFTQSTKRVHSEVAQESCVDDLCSLNIHKSRKSIDGENMLKQLKTSEMTIQEIEEGLGALFKTESKVKIPNPRHIRNRRCRHPHHHRSPTTTTNHSRRPSHHHRSPTTTTNHSLRKPPPPPTIPKLCHLQNLMDSPEICNSLGLIQPDF